MKNFARSFHKRPHHSIPRGTSLPNTHAGRDELDHAVRMLPFAGMGGTANIINRQAAYSGQPRSRY